MGFKALGLEACPVANAEEARETLRRLTKDSEDYAIIYVEENLAQELQHEIDKFKDVPKPAIILMIDFGPEIGIKKSSAQITVHYKPEDLVGRQVMAVVNFPPRQIGPVRSEVLTLGFPDENGKVVLIGPGQPVPDGGRLF